MLAVKTHFDRVGHDTALVVAGGILGGVVAGRILGCHGANCRAGEGAATKLVKVGTGGILAPAAAHAIE